MTTYQRAKEINNIPAYRDDFFTEEQFEASRMGEFYPLVDRLIHVLQSEGRALGFDSDFTDELALIRDHLVDVIDVMHTKDCMRRGAK